MEIPEGMYGRGALRSGMTLKHGVSTGVRVIDQDYQGDVGVIMFNHRNNEVIIKKGDRVAQLIFEKFDLLAFLEVEEIEEIERGNQGFGSTGSKNDPIVISNISSKEEKLVWDEHQKGHWGAFKVREALKKRGIEVPYEMVQKIVKEC